MEIEVAKYRAEAELQAENVRAAEMEAQRIVDSFRQAEGLQVDAIKQIDAAEQRFLATLREME